mgnify:CR=1 FL=1
MMSGMALWTGSLYILCNKLNIFYYLEWCAIYVVICAIYTFVTDSTKYCNTMSEEPKLKVVV